MSKYADNVSGASAGRFQYFISESPRDYRQISAQIQCNVLVHIGDERNEAIHIDETGFPKQDRDSVGVKWQYSGRLGKVDNCQVAVCLGYTNGSLLTLIDAELCIPEDWANDTYQTKAEIAFELIQGAISMEFNLAGVGMNTFYGMQTSLPNVIDLAGIVYIADILSDSNSVKFEIAPRIQIEGFNE
jgi:SRSO17 transposase